MRVLSICLCLAGMLIMSCGESSEDQIDSLAAIQGTVTLYGEWPAEGEIQVSLFSVWHEDMAMAIAPQGPPEFHTEGLSSPTPSGTVHQVSYLIEDVNPDDYPSLVVGWRNGGTLGVDEPVLGVYGGDLSVGDSMPEAVHLNAGDLLELNFDGWLDRIPSTDEENYLANITGTVVFDAGWPASYSTIYAVLMSSDDPALPSNPLTMELVTESDPQFSLSPNLLATAEVYLGIYGYPYEDAMDAFFGGYGWDWAAENPAIAMLPLSVESPSVENIEIMCHTPEPQELGLSISGQVNFPSDWPTDYPGIYVIAMSSADPEVPSMPLAMSPVTQAASTFSMNMQAMEGSDIYLAVYGYPYATPIDAFYGGYGWDWSAGTPQLVALPISAQQTELTGLQLDCQAE